jgi:hypothetical protein
MSRSIKKHPLSIGDIIGRLSIVSGPVYIVVGKSKYSTPHWVCKCICGNDVTVNHYMLARGTTQSCGCLQRERTSESRLIHGESKLKSSEWNTWNGIKQRCKKNSKEKHKYYEAITVCDRWASSFENFLADMGRKPTSKHSIERINNGKGYSPDNCKWATAQEQACNKSNNVKITYAGETLCISEWARKLNMSSHLLRKRYHSGWPPEKILFLKKGGKQYASSV